MSWAHKFCAVVHIIFSIMPALFPFEYKNVYQFACTELTVCNNSEGHKSQNFRLFLQNLFHVIFRML
jgi:hypothetical protein